MRTLLPSQVDVPKDVRAAFHVDDVQGIISKFASKLFEIRVVFVERDSQTFPVIVVPEGVKVPVAAKADIEHPVGTRIIRHGDVYFRTLSANGTPSSAVAKPADWDEITEICLENREADIGRFLRRHLAGSDAVVLASALREILGAQQVGDAQMSPTTTASAGSACERAFSMLAEGERRAEQAIGDRQFSEQEAKILAYGRWHAAMLFSPAHDHVLPDQTFLNTISSSNPRYTGWPAWLDSRGFSDPRSRPYVSDGAWEALIISTAEHLRRLSFSRVSPRGEFYMMRSYQDDASDKIGPGTMLDPILVTLRVAETLAVGLSFAKALGWPQAETIIGVALRWTKLRGRVLEPWANPMVAWHSLDDRAHDDVVQTCCELPADTPVAAIAPYVGQLTAPLFAVFDGSTMDGLVTEQWVSRLLERKL